MVAIQRAFAQRCESFLNSSEVPSAFGMTSDANGEIVAAESSLAVVTSHATKGTASRMMIERFGSRDLSSLGHSRSYLMTFATHDFLMLGVTETYLEGRG